MGDFFYRWKYLLIFLFLVFFDQISKWYFKGKSFGFEGLLYISSTENYGSAFGLFSSIDFYPLIMIFFSVFVLLMIFFYRRLFISNVFGRIFLLFFVSGIVGNLLDRIFFLYVRDFIGFFNLFIFNLADFYLSIAFVFLFFDSFSEDKALKN